MHLQDDKYVTLILIINLLCIRPTHWAGRASMRCYYSSKEDRSSYADSFFDTELTSLWFNLLLSRAWEGAAKQILFVFGLSKPKFQ